MKKMFEKYHLSGDFTATTDNMLVFLLDEKVVNSLLKHIRNAIAHSRWQATNGVYYFEDGSDEAFEDKIEYCVTARIVLKEKSLLQLRNMLLSGPSEEELRKTRQNIYLSQLLTKLCCIYNEKTFNRKEAVDTLNIGNEIWKKLYAFGKKEGKMRMEHNSWKITSK